MFMVYRYEEIGGMVEILNCWNKKSGKNNETYSISKFIEFFVYPMCASLIHWIL